jgi:hypothetical protein
MTTDTEYRISGHETFPCRYTWLPKAVRGLDADSRLFADEERAMVDLGVGKNVPSGFGRSPPEWQLLNLGALVRR